MLLGGASAVTQLPAPGSDPAIVGLGLAELRAADRIYLALAFDRETTGQKVEAGLFRSVPVRWFDRHLPERIWDLGRLR